MSHPFSEYSDEEIERIRHRCNRCNKWIGTKRPGDSGYCHNCEKEMGEKNENSRLKDENDRLKLELENMKLKNEIDELKLKAK
jgi:hypothetical protein